MIQLSDEQLDNLENNINLTQEDLEFLSNIRSLGNIVFEVDFDKFSELAARGKNADTNP